MIEIAEERTLPLQEMSSNNDLSKQMAARWPPKYEHLFCKG